MLKWATNIETLATDSQDVDSQKEETEKDFQYSVVIVPSNEKSDSSNPKEVVNGDHVIEELGDQVENVQLSDLSPLKKNSNQAISAMSLDFPFSCCLSSPSVDSGFAFSKSSLISKSDHIIESLCRSSCNLMMLSNSPSRTYMSQLAVSSWNCPPTGLLESPLLDTTTKSRTQSKLSTPGIRKVIRSAFRTKNRAKNQKLMKKQDSTTICEYPSKDYRLAVSGPTKD
eukprot:GFUD01105501.1.p1 GENE.GFUD01105501.1~~GFUD01105501.1.p1  ORF type:complete len:227 (+),score=60.56 GFUD01105501.1:33-713(+)